MITSSHHAHRGNETASSCTSHCRGQCVPACTGGGHCVPNICSSLSQRPSRADMLAWALRRSVVERQPV